MSVKEYHGPANLLGLPDTWRANLVQHVASGAGGLASAAALSQTCKSFHALSESSAVTYSNLRLKNSVDSLDHPFFRWLEKRHTRVTGLTAALRLTVGVPESEPEQLQVLFAIPGLHLTLDLISTGCYEDIVKLSSLHPVADPLVQLSLRNSKYHFSVTKLESVSSLSLLSQLTSLSLAVDCGAEEPWNHLVGLTNLKHLSLQGAASGDPSLVSALTGLSSLKLHSYGPEHNGLLTPCTFSSLQPLSTLQQLKKLDLSGEACTAVSLHGLAELSRLTTLRLD